MNNFEKIKAMNIDEMAEFIDSCSNADGFTDHACRACPMHGREGVCKSKDMRKDCTAAFKARLMQEVKDDGSRKNKNPVE